MLDKSAAGIMLGLAVGRIGCTLNGDAAGTRTSSSWGLVYTNPDSFAPLNVPTQPAPIYEILCLIVIVGVLIWLRRRVRPEWSLFLIMLALYSFARFFISWVRDEPAVLGPLHQSHIISIVLFVVAVALLIYRGVHFVEGSSSEPEDEAGVDAS
jgi:phosphatidylglycerol:prolipoprotein diacylglycerol transferase